MSIYFSIHSPLAGRDNTCCHVWLVAGFSIHSPLAERDEMPASVFRALQRFQSTRPLRGETFFKALSHRVDGFSIHSPLAGRDHRQLGRHGIRVFFNPLAPCGARRASARMTRRPCRFQSTRPLRGETDDRDEMNENTALSIHSPLAGRDKPPRR